MGSSPTLGSVPNGESEILSPSAPLSPSPPLSLINLKKKKRIQLSRARLLTHRNRELACCLKRLACGRPFTWQRLIRYFTGARARLSAPEPRSQAEPSPAAWPGPLRRCAAVPEGRELHLLVVVGGELRDEAEVGDLRGRPAELEDDDEGPIVEEGGPLGRGCPAAQAGAEDEGEGQQDTDGACG